MTVAVGLAPLAIPFMDPAWLFASLGPWFLAVSALIIVTECALFPVLPGDSLLFAAGMFVAQDAGIRVGGLDKMGSLAATMGILVVAAVLGNVIGYWVGARLSPWLFRERDNAVGRIFSPERLAQTTAFFERYGARALVLGRFVPFVRTFVTMVAGAAGMSFRTFITWTGIGALAWAAGITLLGFFLGNIDVVKDNLELALVLIVLISVVPVLVEVLRERAAVGGAAGR